MIILGVETSCDDTAVALVKDGREVLGSLISSQVRLHRKFGGIVPEVASRQHLKFILPLLEKLLANHKLRPQDIDAIAVTNGPGLLGSLLVGVSTTKTLAYVWKKPLIAIDHLIAHIYGSFINQKTLPKKFPIIALIVSGGHTELVLMEGLKKFRIIGGTRDDAAGEAFDKAAKILGLGYPGGPAIAASAAKLKIKNLKLAHSTMFRVNAEPVEALKIELPRPMISGGLEMSFSGLKTALMRINKTAPVGALAFEFQEAVTDVLIIKTEKAIKKFNPQAIVIAGGVAANRRLRERMIELTAKYKLPIYMPELRYCADNAAMVALAAYFLRKGSKQQWYNVDVTTESVLFSNG